MRDKSVFQTSPKNIMAQRDFYKLEPLNHVDKQALKWWFKTAMPGVKEMRQPSMRRFLQDSLVFEGANLLDRRLCGTHANPPLLHISKINIFRKNRGSLVAMNG